MSRKVKTKLGFAGQLSEATIELPAGEPDPWGPDAKLDVVGKDAPRLDALAKVTGQARYTTDIKRPDMLHARVLRSPHAAAAISAIDVAPAKAVAGVAAAVALPVKTARYVGQPLAAVAATSEAIAEAALQKIVVRAKPRPFVVDLDAAIKAGAPRVFDKGPAPIAGHSANVRRSRARRRGDVAGALKKAKHVAKATFRTQVATHCSLEPHAVVVHVQGDRAEVWCSTQSTFGVRTEIAGALGLDAGKVVVHAEYVGGGFGSKFHAGTEGVLCAKLSKSSGKPVRLVLDRREEQIDTGNRPDSLQRLTLAADGGGMLAAMKTVSYGTGGVAGGAGTASPLYNLYDCANKAALEHDVFTNAGEARPFRAPGHPQGAFALEQTIDMLAERAGVDPLIFRLRNDKNPVRRAQLIAGAKRIGWNERNNKTPGGGPALGPHKSLRRGVGVANGLWYNTGRSGGGAITIKISADGHVDLVSGGQDIGTGARTVLAMVAAEQLGVPLSQVRTSIGHTTGPHAPASGGSTTTPTMTPAARNAAHRARLALEPVARKVLGVDATAALTFAGGHIGAGGKRVPFAKVAARLPEAQRVFTAQRAANYQAYRQTVAGVQLAEVEVDVETGVVRVLRVVAVQDAGRLLNPLTARSQVNGAVLQGLSYAMFEERVMDGHLGHMLNANLEQYKIGGALDVPAIDVMLFDVYNGSNSTGALGLGEPPIVSTAAAIANAVYNACGARVHELPITPARVLAALSRARAAKNKPPAPAPKGGSR